MKKTNLLWIVSDQHRFCDTGYRGNTEVCTPTLDVLKSQGICFNNAYSSSPLCVPARGCLLTGLHALKHGAVANDMPVHTDCESIATVLDREGYDTAYIGKWHIGGIPRKKFITEEERLGFKYWRGHECNHNYLNGYYDDNDNIRHPIKGYSPIMETNLAIEYIEQRPKDQPFALFLNYGIPHDPYNLLPEGELEKWEHKDLQIRKNVQKLRETENPEGFDSPMKALAGYYAHIEQLDNQIARLLAYFDSTKLSEETLIIYTSDHGDMLGSQGYLKKQIYFEESSHVPLLLCWKNHLASRELNACIASVDLAPTVLGLLGCCFSTPVDGEDLSALVTGQMPDYKRPVYFYNYVPCHNAAKRYFDGSWRAISDGEYVLAVTQMEQPLGFYNIIRDPLQQKDLSNDPDYFPLFQTYLQILNSYITKNDGYKPWIDLLAENGLIDVWNASEKHFFG